jgi:hypothetical protein
MNGKRYFWGSLNESQREDAGAYAIRYQLSDFNATSIELFKVFPDKKVSQATSPAISYDGKKLIVQMVRRNEYEIRIFDLQNMIQQGDFSHSYSHRFILNRIRYENGPRALQALASDGERVFLLMGSFKVDELNKLNIYTMNGALLESLDLHSGENHAKSTATGVHYEPEGLTWIKTPSGGELVVQIASGDGKNRSCNLYRTKIYAENK